MSSQNTLLTAKQGNEGTFVNWLKDLGLDDFIKKDTRCLQAFLCCLLARNYFAHHIYLDSELRRSEESGFMMSGILVTVLILLTIE